MRYLSICSGIEAVPVMHWIGRRLASWFDSTSNPRQ